MIENHRTAPPFRCPHGKLAGFGWLACWLLVSGGRFTVAQDSPTVPKVDSAMRQDPCVDIPRTTLSVPRNVQPLWLQALRSDEDELKQQAAFSIAWSYQRGLTDWSDAIEPLRHNLTGESSRIVRLAAAHALVALDARESAESLFRQSRQDGLEMAQIVEPALARWDYRPIRPVWRERLNQLHEGQRYRLLAIRGLGTVRDPESADALTKIATDPLGAATLRIAAGESLGRIRTQGLESAADRLNRDQAAMIDRLVAARLLRHHESDAAQRLLVDLAQDAESCVAALALERLLELDPEKILPMTEALRSRGDSKVRRAVAEALIACPSVPSMTQLGLFLRDPHPEIRRRVRDVLIDLAQSGEFVEEILRQGRAALADGDWRGQEQAIHVLARLKQASQVERFLELLGHERPEVYVTAAWGLRELAEPDALAPSLQFARDRLGQRNSLLGTPMGVGVDEQLAQLFQWFGQARYAPSEELLTGLVPEAYNLNLPRAAAIWALGYLHQEDPPEQLVQALVARMRDTNPPEPESEIVRRFSAVALGRMRARSALATLRWYRQTAPIETEIQFAAAWAIQQITGEPFEKPQPGRRVYGQFFLEPYPVQP